MAEQQSRLAIIIDSTGAKRNVDGLAGALEKMTQAGQKAAGSADKTSKATKDEASALSALLDRIDPVNAALNRLDEQQRQLAKFQAKGFLDTDTFNQYSQKIEQTRDSLTKYADSAGKAGASSKQLAASMRMVPAQMTDIIVSLASGQAPMTVLLQQGGQLKDMFGGIGPAIRGVGTYVAGLINPFTLAAAAAGALALAYYEGSQEQDAFNQSLILTGNTVGKTAGQLSDMAAQIAKTTGATQGASAAVLNQLVSTGKVAGDSLQSAATAIVNISQVTGQSTDKLVSDFSKIAKDPVKAISELNDQYHFLSLATYNQITALEEEGRTQDAAALAAKTYSDTLNQRSKGIKDNLGYLETAWNAVANAAKHGWDAMLDAGRPASVESKIQQASTELEQAQKELADLEKGQAANAGPYGYWKSDDVDRQKKVVANLKARISGLQAEKVTQDVLNDSVDNYNERQQKGIEATQRLNAERETLMTNEQKRAKERKKLMDDFQASADAGMPVSAEEQKSLLAALNDRYKDPKTPKASSPHSPGTYTEDAGTKMLDQLRQQQAALTAQYDTGDKLTTQAQALVNWEQQLADLKSKKTLTADQKSLLASADLITSQLQQNAALERQIETRKKLLALDKARADITRTITNRQNQYATDELFAGGGLSQNEQQQYTQRLSLEQSYNDKITQLRQSRAQATSDVAREEIDQEIQLQQQALQTELSNYDAHMQKMNQLRGSFTSGASRAWQEYQDSATNVSAMSEQLFTNAFTGMEDSLVSFVTTGKASFSDFANSVLSDIARIAARQALVGLGTSIFSAAGGMFGGTAAAASASSSNAFSGGAYNNLSLNAKGGVYDSPSLSAYSGGIYDSPKFFAFAKGAGVFGEAGPEAIMPLKRGPDGSLGVQLHSGGQASGGSVGDIIIQQTIHVSGNGDAALQRAMEEAARKGANDGAKRARQDMLQDFQNRGQARRLLGV